MYAHWGAYANHIENKHPDKHQPFTPFPHRPTDVHEHPEHFIEQPAPVLTDEGFGRSISDNDEDDLGQEDIDQDDLYRIQQLYGDFLSVQHDDLNDPANDSDAEPVDESSNSPPRRQCI